MMLASNWGASQAERAMRLECDYLLGEASIRLHRAVSIEAPPAVVFRWLCQLKIAPYSYDLLDNFGRTSPRELTPGTERLEGGQRFMTIFSLESFAPDEHITLRSRRTAVTYAVREDGTRSRLLARVLFDPPAGRLGSALIGRALAVGDLVMMRKQLLTLKALAERSAASVRPRRRRCR